MSDCKSREGGRQARTRNINPATIRTASIMNTNTRSDSRSTTFFPTKDPSTMIGPSASPTATAESVSTDVWRYATSFVMCMTTVDMASVPI